MPFTVIKSSRPRFVISVLAVTSLCLVFWLNNTNLLDNTEPRGKLIFGQLTQSSPTLEWPSCQTSVPKRIKSWAGNDGLVTAVQPPVGSRKLDSENTLAEHLPC